jgi:hypothetical protein
MEGVVDEIIVIDSSSGAEAKRLDKLKVQLKRKKTKVIRFIYMRMYELSKEYGLAMCSGDWILSLDTDERISSEFKKDLRKIIENADCNGFYCVRRDYETPTKSRPGDGLLRLFRNKKVHYLGTMHEFPVIDGVARELQSDKYYIKHLDKLFRTGASANAGGKYLECEAYLRRQSYRILLDRLKGRPMIHRLAGFYLSIKGRRDSDEELSRFDYWIAFTANSLTWSPNVIRKQGLVNYIRLLNFNQNYENSKIRYFFSLPEKERRLQFNISNDIYWAGGPIKYLRFDNLRQIKLWIKKYAYLKNEKPVIFDMLKYEYAKRHGGNSERSYGK